MLQPLGNRSLVPPGTGMRLGTAVRMGTAGGRPMSGRRTGQIPNTASREAAVGMALAQEVQVSDRPVTQQGMSGMKTAGGGPGRSVADGSYFLGVLRGKVSEIQKEMQSLRKEIDANETDNSAYSQLERRYESLLQEVKNLEGTLADFNLAMDKVRTTADPEEVAAYLHELEDRNRRAAKDLDNIFLVKQQREQARRDVEGQMMNLHRQLEDQISMLDPHRVQQYRDLLAQSQDLAAAVEQRQAESDHLASVIREHELHLRDSSLRDVYREHEKQVGKLRRERETLMEELQMMRMEPKAAKDALLSKVKQNQERSKQIDKRLAEANGEADRMKKVVQELDAELKSGRKGEIDQTKVEMLRKKDEEMTQVIDRFDENRLAILEDQRRAQEVIVGLMEHISQGLEAQHTIPEGEEKMTELKDEASFKDKQLKSSEMTMKRLQLEKEKRMQEMSRLDNLDQKIPANIAGLDDKIRRMRTEMEQFEDIENLRRQAEATKDYLTKLRSRYIKRKDTIKVQVQQLSSDYEALKKELAMNETHKMLEGLEQKLRSHEGNIFQVREFIEVKSRQIDFETLQKDCKNIVRQVNEILINNPQVDRVSTAY